MTVSLSSWISSLICSSILILFIRILRKKYMVTTTYESRFLFVLYLLCMLRLFLPLDFFFSKGIDMDGFYSDILKLIYINKIHIASFNFSILQVVCLLFYAISAVKLLQLFLSYRKEKRFFDSCLSYRYLSTDSIKQQLMEQIPNLPDVSILKCSAVSSPLAIGIFRKLIILPDISFQENELYYILLHEYTHFIRHDLTLKFFANIFCCVFWWFPFASFARKDFSHVFELECDMQVIKCLSKNEQLDYAATILNVLKNQNSSVMIQKPSLSVSFAVKESELSIKERFNMIFHHENTQKNTFKLVIVSILFAVCFLVSYTFAPLPSYRPDRTEIEQNGAVYITPESTYLIKENDQYYIVTNEEKPIYVPKEHVNNLLTQGIPIMEK